MNLMIIIHVNKIECYWLMSNDLVVDAEKKIIYMILVYVSVCHYILWGNEPLSLQAKPWRFSSFYSGAQNGTLAILVCITEAVSITEHFKISYKQAI